MTGLTPYCVVAVVVMLLLRYQGTGWAAGLLGGAVIAVASPIVYYSGIAFSQNHAITKEMAQLQAQLGPDADIVDLRMQFQAFLDSKGFTYVDPSRDLSITRKGEGLSLDLRYAYVHDITQGIRIEVDFPS